MDDHGSDVAEREVHIDVAAPLALRVVVVAMIVREAGALVSIGIAAGLLLALAGGRAAKALLFGLTPNDPLTLGVAVVGLAAVALVASYLPARVASRIEPTVALRVE